MVYGDGEASKGSSAGGGVHSARRRWRRSRLSTVVVIAQMKLRGVSKRWRARRWIGTENSQDGEEGERRAADRGEGEVHDAAACDGLRGIQDQPFIELDPRAKRRVHGEVDAE